MYRLRPSRYHQTENKVPLKGGRRRIKENARAESKAEQGPTTTPYANADDQGAPRGEKDLATDKGRATCPWAIRRAWGMEGVTACVSSSPGLLSRLFEGSNRNRLLINCRANGRGPRTRSSCVLCPTGPSERSPICAFVTLFDRRSVGTGCSTFMPGAHLRVCSFPGVASMPTVSKSVSGGRCVGRMLLPCVQRGKLTPLVDAGLEGILFTRSHDSVLVVSKRLPGLAARRLSRLIRFRRGRSRLTTECSCGPICGLPLRTIRASGKVLFFDSAGVKQRKLGDFCRRLSNGCF